ncbi:MerR family transcriptional regulator [Bifidobacterium amazonense]|uniref:MerR family transcriptional regulator n=1 Tax=Bifidobacterium amazonense TaxID=2809027 RepID=A0ABS9VY71_9BIFI|nr:MerR family transcriptional regulator [Bifidobacterium amazonense]MCH9276876.1 MerR family transcriptional regulator [Bifidobacterium amazonense]
MRQKEDGGMAVANADDSSERAAVERMYSIREVCAMFGMEPSTLRWYEEIGLLYDVGRAPSGRRVYREGHLHRLRTICCFKHAGMSIGDLQRFFGYEVDEEHHIGDMVQLLRDHRAELERKQRELAEAHAHILRKLHFYGDLDEYYEHGGSKPDWGDYRNAVFDA